VLATEGRRGFTGKFALSVAAFNRISQYDVDATSRHQVRRQPRAVASQSVLRQVQVCCGENFHQRAALACVTSPASGSWSPLKQLQNRLSCNNVPTPTRTWE
jgi:phosphoribosylaminoimidazolecarboxamide formyltransferase/IMP cyclohydrolase